MLQHLKIREVPSSHERFEWLTNLPNLTCLELPWVDGDLALQVLPRKDKLPKLEWLKIGTDCNANFYPLLYHSARERALSLTGCQHQESLDDLGVLGLSALAPLYDAHMHYMP